MRFAISILASALAAYALGFWLAVPANPEVKFWREVVERRDREINKVRKSQPDTPIIFFTGGSSTAFSIDPAVIEDTLGLPAFNLGLPVAAGAEYLIHQALEKTRRGDILVLCLEPDILAATTPEASPSKFSFAMATAGGRVGDSGGGTTFNVTPSLRQFLTLSRPGAGHIVTHAGRVASGKDYRYKIADIRYRGRIETPVRGATPAAARSSSRLSSYGRELLETSHASATKRGVRLFYAMPWHFTETTGVITSRQAQKQLSEEIQTIIPTLDDGFTGVADNPDWFSDSAQHLTEEGSRVRSNALATPLKQALTSH